jgi:hypothetical protein
MRGEDLDPGGKVVRANAPSELPMGGTDWNQNEKSSRRNSLSSIQWLFIH